MVLQSMLKKASIPAYEPRHESARNGHFACRSARAVDELVRAGLAINRNQFIALAVETELRRRERAAIDAEFAIMGSDSEYQAEADRIMRDFRVSDDETWTGLEGP